MKKLIIAACFSCALIAANAAEGEHKTGAENKKAAPGQEQKAIRKELVEKYDADKNGKLNKEEKSKMTPEDLEKWNSVAASKKKEAGEAKPKEGEKK